MDLMEAKALALGRAVPLDVEWVVLEQSPGRVLARSLVSPADLPAQNRSRMDGYALRSLDVAEASVLQPRGLRLLPGSSAAGADPPGPLAAGECRRIFTGAPLPPGADAVAPQERVERSGDRVLVVEKLDPGQWVSQAGEEVRKGEEVLRAGDLLTPTRTALAAATGATHLPVHRRPRVALLATGDELREAGCAGDGPLSVCNNRHLLSWLVRWNGGAPFSLGIAPDDPAVLEERLRGVGADLAITTGSTGRGDRDFMEEVWNSLGVEVLFSSLNLSPGKGSRLGVARDGKDRSVVFAALSGNPWAAQVVFQEILAPLLWRWQGAVRLSPLEIPAVLAEPLRKRKGRYQAVRGRLEKGGRGFRFIPQPRERSFSFSVLRDHFAYAILDSETEALDAGAPLIVRSNDLPWTALGPLAG